MVGIFIAPADETLGATIDAMNKATREWTAKAARGECGWICSDCCCSFPEGMPDECANGDQRCTDIIKRDKVEAAPMKATLRKQRDALLAFAEEVRHTGDARLSSIAAMNITNVKGGAT